MIKSDALMKCCRRRLFSVVCGLWSVVFLNSKTSLTGLVFYFCFSDLWWCAFCFDKGPTLRGWSLLVEAS